MRAGDEVFSLYDLEHFVGDRTRGGVSGEGVKHEFLAALSDRRHDTVRRVDAADRCVTPGEALPCDHDVRHDVPVVNGELLAGAAESAHHLIRDEQHAVSAADLGHARPVAVRRNERAAGGAHYGFGDERGDGVGPFAQDDLFKLIGGLIDGSPSE